MRVSKKLQKFFHSSKFPEKLGSSVFSRGSTCTEGEASDDAGWWLQQQLTQFNVAPIHHVNFEDHGERIL